MKQFAFSVRQPFAWAILHANQDMVTKEWPAGSPALRNAISLIGQELLLHAGSGCGKHEFHNGVMNILVRSDARLVISGLTVLDQIEDRWRVDDALPFGALVGSVKLQDIVWTDRRGHRYAYRGEPIPFGAPCLFCGMRRTNEPGACRKRGEWAETFSVGLYLTEAKAFAEPIRFKGTTGFFPVPEEVMARVPLREETHHTSGARHPGPSDSCQDPACVDKRTRFEVQYVIGRPGAMDLATDQLARAINRATDEHGRPNSFGCAELEQYGGPVAMLVGRVASDPRCMARLAETLKELGWEGVSPTYGKDRRWTV